MMRLIFHITHIDNLPRIIAADGLQCDRLRGQIDETCVGIAHQHIKDRRAKKAVPVAAQGTLADYVPFYFAPRSPMLYAIHTGSVADYVDGQKPVVHLVSSVECAVSQGRPWCFTDGHAGIAFSSFFDDLNNLDKIDWRIMKATYWNDTDLDLDRKRRRQAEFLVYESYPWTAITHIGVFDKDLQMQVAEIVSRAVHQPQVTVKRNWYY